MDDIMVPLTLAGPLLLGAVALLSRHDPEKQKKRVLEASRAATALTILIAAWAAVHVSLHGPTASQYIGIDPLALSLRLDALSVIMLALVAFVGYIVVRFSQNYLDGDKRQGVFVGRLCLTLCAVAMLVLSGSLLQLVVAWVGTSVALHRLLLFYEDRPRAAAAARKKFICARIGDGFLILAALLLYLAFGTGDLTQILKLAREMADNGETPVSAMGAALSIVLAAAFKSAQFPFHGWLTEVMETPAPVSALLHAGVVNAGGFLVVRLSDVVVLSPVGLNLLVIIGAATALIGTVVMMAQTNVKAGLAWSTISQMGFMLLQCGFGAFSAAALHIVAHSLYKAHAFLNSGTAAEPDRRLEVPSLQSLPRPMNVLAGVAAAGLIFIAVGYLMGASPKNEPALVALGAILALGLSQLLVRGLSGAAGDHLAGRLLLAVVGLSMAYFALQHAAAWILAGTVAGPVGLSPVQFVPVIALFAGAAVMQWYLPAWSTRWPALYVHAANGFYANAVLDRVLGSFNTGRTRNH
jgi:NAD(P)H-quinone oxidoreductase subunit 5